MQETFLNRDGPYAEGADGFTLTSGSWPTEHQSCAALDERLERVGLFKVFREVTGYYLQPRLGQDHARPRIDRILWPTKTLMAQGWKLGPVGVECKRSDVKIGRPLSQMLDYSRAAFELPDIRVHVILQWSFLWPCPKLSGSLASICAQNRIGALTPASQWGPILKFTSGEAVLASFDRDGLRECPEPVAGIKAGSR